VRVPEAQRRDAKVALDRMLELKAQGGIREMARD